MEQTQAAQTEMITKDMTVDDVFAKFPGKAQKLAHIMTAAGLHCVGCHASTYETLEQGTTGHGMSPADLDNLLRKMNVALQSAESAQETGGVTLTETAAAKVQALLAQEKKSGWGLKLGLMPGGCSGYQYELLFQEREGPDDLSFTDRSVKVIIAREHAEKLSGVEIDYVDGLQGAGFKINNPHVQHSCGCGSSMGF
ncbi:MAG TPA: iron-sulfur cluster assembly accessory protein [Candidatus Nanoarchaeia archaeon]|nr:iron-sulfur cluster assembly accessory protein [Candidatus Nanoarchaeia archaeon]